MRLQTSSPKAFYVKFAEYKTFCAEYEVWKFRVDSKTFMTYIPKILAFAGALRRGSVNKKTVMIAAKGAESAGAEVNFIDLKDFPLPLYDGDLEDADGMPESAVRLQNLLLEHDGFLISSPEYNSGISGTLKTYIDWVSRPRGELRPGAVFADKYASIMSASPGGLGGIRALPSLRTIIASMGVHVLAEDFALGRAHEAFDENGNAKVEFVHNSLEKLGKNLAETLQKIKLQ